MLSTEAVIQRVRRDINIAAALKIGFFIAIFCCLMIGPALLKMLALGLVICAWVWLSFTSAKGSRIAADSPLLIASGQYEEAEQRIDQAIGTFSLFQAVKLQALHQLAILRHAQHRWQESATLCRALVSRRLGQSRVFSRQAMLLLGESLLEMDDLPGAYQAIVALYGQQLSLGEVLHLLLAQLDYESRLGAWDRMMQAAPSKVQLAELMPAQQAARAQALLALAAKKTDQSDWFNWLRQRAQLLADPQTLCADRPILKELWYA